MFVPLISRPTAITSNTATLIDNIFSNNLENHAFSGLFFTDLSDHLPVFTVTLEEVECVNIQIRITLSAIKTIQILINSTSA